MGKEGKVEARPGIRLFQRLEEPESLWVPQCLAGEEDSGQSPGVLESDVTHHEGEAGLTEDYQEFHTESAVATHNPQTQEAEAGG